MKTITKSQVCLIILLLLCYTIPFYSQEITVSKDSIKTLVRLASNYYEKAENKKSISLAQQALNLAYKNNHQEFAATSYNVIGLNYTEFGDYKKAEEVYLKGLKSCENTGNKLIASFINSNLAYLYQTYFKQSDKAIFYNKKSLQYAIDQNLDYDILVSYINIAIIYFEIEDYENLDKYLKLAKPYLQKVNDNSFYISYYSLIAQYYNHKGDYTTAEKNFLIAESYCPKDNDISLYSAHAMDLYDDMGYFYEKYNQKEKGYDYLKRYITLKDTIYSLEKTNAIANHAAKIDVEEFKREINEIGKLSDQQQKALYYSKIIYVLSGIILFILIAFVLILIKSKNRKNRLISEERINSEALKLAKIRAEELSDAKSQFIGKVSHELRTPLYGIIGLADILYQDFPILRNNVALKSLNFSARYLMNLINDLLQLQKIESKTIKIEQQEYHLQDEITALIESLQVVAHKSKNNLRVNYKYTITDVVLIDKLKLNQILLNLISNSLKFTSNGDIMITVEQQPLTDGKIYLNFSIQDSGVGISKENLSTIFEKFTQFSTNGTDYQGTGLGLSIVKQLTDILDGTIDVKSELGVGTTFKISIPCGVSEISEINYLQDLGTHFDFKSLQILLIENNEINRLVNQRAFANFRIPCTIVSSAQEALAIMESQSFDVILTDINMPEMDGFEFSSLIRANGNQLPIIALTAYTKEDVFIQIENSGIDDLVTKPFEFKTLLHCIYNVIQNKSIA